MTYVQSVTYVRIGVNPLQEAGDLRNPANSATQSGPSRPPGPEYAYWRTLPVDPGATHRRFEHSLGVMELADRVFSVITQKQNLTEDVRRLVPEFGDSFSWSQP